MMYNVNTGQRVVIHTEHKPIGQPCLNYSVVQVQANLILDGVLDAYLKTHNFSVFYPLLSLVCGDMAEDAAAGMEAGQLVEDLFQTASEALLHRWAWG